MEYLAVILVGIVFIIFFHWLGGRYAELVYGKKERDPKVRLEEEDDTIS